VAERISILLTPEPLDPSEALRFVSDPGSGATCLFEGTVRSSSNVAEGEVTNLTYEAYGELALERMREIADEMLERWPVRRVALHHRTGALGVGETSVVIACSAPHRAEAFEACRQGIERIKQEVPIWKQEHLTSGNSVWVRGS